MYFLRITIYLDIMTYAVHVGFLHSLLFGWYWYLLQQQARPGSCAHTHTGILHPVRIIKAQSCPGYLAMRRFASLLQPWSVTVEVARL